MGLGSQVSKPTPSHHSSLLRPHPTRSPWQGVLQPNSTPTYCMQPGASPKPNRLGLVLRFWPQTCCPCLHGKHTTLLLPPPHTHHHTASPHFLPPLLPLVRLSLSLAAQFQSFNPKPAIKWQPKPPQPLHMPQSTTSLHHPCMLLETAHLKLSHSSSVPDFQPKPAALPCTIEWQPKLLQQPHTLQPTTSLYHLRTYLATEHPKLSPSGSVPDF